MPELVQRTDRPVDVAQLSGHLNPGDRMVGDRYVMHLDGHAPASESPGSLLAAREDELAVISESVRLYHELAAARPGVHRAALAKELPRAYRIDLAASPTQATPGRVSSRFGRVVHGGARERGSRGGFVVSVDVVDLIMQDHREMERLFDEMKQHPDKRPLLVPVLAAVLTAHSRAEEAEVYPVAKDDAGEQDEVEHSQHEHAEAEQLLTRLVETDPTAKEFDSVLTELVESVSHHVEEEESHVLPGMRQRLDDKRRAELGRAFAASRAQHMGDRPGQASLAELRLQARNAGISGASGMSKKELTEQLRSS